MNKIIQSITMNMHIWYFLAAGAIIGYLFGNSFNGFIIAVLIILLINIFI